MRILPLSSLLQHFAPLAGAATLAIGMIGVSASAAERDPAYAAARSAGQVGEQVDGYLGMISGGADIRRMVEDINIKRKAVYASKAQEQHATVEDYAFTSGCLLISKRRSALRSLHRQMRDGEIRKHYQALLVGSLPQRVVEVRLPLRKNLLRGGERMVQVDELNGKPARTVFRRVAAYGGLTLVEVELHTGRTHQIRVHAASLAVPVAGDEKYGDAEANRALRQQGLKRLFLHAAALSFRPQEVAPPVRVEAPLPSDLSSLLQRQPVQWRRFL